MNTRQLNKLRGLEGVDSVEVKNDGEVVVYCSDGCPWDSYMVIAGIEEKTGEPITIDRAPGGAKDEGTG